MKDQFLPVLYMIFFIFLLGRYRKEPADNSPHRPFDTTAEIKGIRYLQMLLVGKHRGQITG